MILFGAGALFLVNHAIKAEIISAFTGIYGCLTVSGIAAVIGMLLSRRKPEGGLIPFEGALVLAYGALVTGFKEYTLFHPSPTFLGLIGLATASLFLAYKKSSQLVALLAIGFAGYSFILFLGYSSGLTLFSKFFLLYGVTIGAFLMALEKRWYFVALMSYALWYLIAHFSLASAWHWLALFASFSMLFVSLLYAFFVKTDSYLESVLVALITITVRRSYSFYSLVSFLFPSLEGAQIPFYLNESTTSLTIGAFFLGALFVFYKRKEAFSPLEVTLYLLFYMLYTGALFSLADPIILEIHYSAWSFALVGILRSIPGLCKLALGLELYNWIALMLHPSNSLAGFQGWGIFLLALPLLVLVSFVVGHLLSYKDASPILNYKDLAYGLGFSSVLFGWVVVMHFQLGAPYMGLFPALYGLIILQTLPSDRQRVLTASVGVTSFGMATLYILSRYILVYNKNLFPETRPFSQGDVSGLSLFVILKQATILLGITALVGFFLYLGIGKQKKSVMQSFYVRVKPFIEGTAFLALFLLVRLYLIAAVRFFVMVFGMKNRASSFLHFSSSVVPPLTGSLAFYENSILTAYYALIGLGLLAAGSAYKKPWIRVTGIIMLLSVVGWILSGLGINVQGFAEQFVRLALEELLF